MRVLVACEFSGIVRDAFARLGHDAWSCDLLPTERPGNHLIGDVREYLDDGWDLMIAHPPCTYLTRAGWRWVNEPDQATLPLKGEPRRQAAIAAAKFFMDLLNAGAPKIAVENPRPIVHVGLPPPSQRIQPWMFGHMETKETFLWLKNLPPLVPTANVKEEMMKLPKRERNRIHYASPGVDRGKLRSVTYRGIAEAMAEQWGGCISP